MSDGGPSVSTKKLLVGVPLGVVGAFFMGAVTVGGVSLPWAIAGGLAWIVVMVLLARWNPRQ